MIYLVLSILSSLTVGVLLKLAKRYEIDLIQSICWNYLSAIVLSILIFRPSISDIKIDNLNGVHYFLGLLLPSLFLIMGFSVQKVGLVRTDIAQRLSLFISFSAAFFLFNEQFTELKGLGMSLGILAILFTLYKPISHKIDTNSWIYPILVFFGYGLVDVSFKWISASGQIPYTTALLLIFILAFCFSCLWIVYLIITKKSKFQLINLICGLILGIFNFSNILFYMKAHIHMKDDPSIVFAGMNMGVIIGACIIGVYLFKENLNKWNYLGLVLALTSIICMTLVQYGAK